MGGKLSTIAWVANSRDVSWDALEAVIPGPDGKDTVLHFDTKLVPATSLLKAREDAEGYNQVLTKDADLQFYYCFKLKVSKNVQGGLRMCGAAMPGLKAIDCPLPTRGKLPRERVEALTAYPMLELPFEFPDSSRKIAVLKFSPPNDSARFTEKQILDAGFVGVCMYICDDTDKVLLYTYVKRVPAALAAGKAKEVMDKIQSLSNPPSAAGPDNAAIRPTLSALSSSASAPPTSTPVHTLAFPPEGAEGADQATGGSVPSAKAAKPHKSGAGAGMEPLQVLYGVLFAQTFLLCLLIWLYMGERQRSSELQTELAAARGGPEELCSYLLRSTK